MHDDILRSQGSKFGVVLVMQDLSAAFDTIDHTILLNRINNMLGIEGAALNWFRQYHDGREHVIIIVSSASSPITLGFGPHPVP